MAKTLTLAARYLRYYLSASNGRGHGIHSPFVFDFIIHVLNDRRHYYAYTQVEGLRESLLQNNRKLMVQDAGAGSTIFRSPERSIADIARYASKPKKFGQLLFRMVHYYQPTNIIELGSSLGISSSYLAMADTRIPVLTLEGSASVAAEAVANFDALGLANIRLIEGNFDDTLPRILGLLDQVSFVFIDGNHRKEPTWRYFNQLLEKVNADSILVFDDIHWSKEMEEVWEMIRSNPAVTLTIDLFFIGIVFFRKDFKEKQDFIIRF